MIRSSRRATVTTGAIALGLIAAPAMVMTGCSSSQSQVAATVNGENIDEQTITDYVQDFRKTNDLEDDTKWAQWLVDNNLTADTVRSDAIDYYVRQTCIDQDAESKGITVTDDDVNQQINEIKDYYGYDDDKLNEQLEQIGYTQDTYREYVKQSLIQEKLMDATYDESQSNVSDDDILKSAQSYSSIINGAKDVKCIVLGNDEHDKADQLHQQAVDNADGFDQLASDNSESTDYDGWDIAVTQPSAVSSALENMNKGDISDVIDTGDNLFIVKVNDVLTIGDDGITSIDQLPDGIKDVIKDNLTQSDKSTQFDTYVENLVNNADKTTNDKPSGLPYDVSTDGVTPSENSAAATSNNTASSDDSASADNADESDSGNSTADNGATQTTTSDDGTVTVTTSPMSEEDAAAANTTANDGGQSQSTDASTN